MSSVIAFAIGFLLVAVITTVVAAMGDRKKNDSSYDIHDVVDMGTVIDTVLNKIEWDHGMIKDR